MYEDQEEEDGPPASSVGHPPSRAESVVALRAATEDGDDDRVLAAAQQCEALTSSDGVDKDTALKILRLYHLLERMRHASVVEKDKTVEQMRTELAMSRLTHENAETLRKATVDIGMLKNQIAAVGDSVQILLRRVDELEQRSLATAVTKKR